MIEKDGSFEEDWQNSFLSGRPRGEFCCAFGFALDLARPAPHSRLQSSPVRMTNVVVVGSEAESIANALRETLPGHVESTNDVSEGEAGQSKLGFFFFSFPRCVASVPGWGASFPPSQTRSNALLSTLAT